jgi:putative transposase
VTKAKTTGKTTKGATPKRKPGRPKGSKNKPKAAASMSPELQRIQTLVQDLLQFIAGLFPLTYLLLDGHFGNGASVQMAQQCGLHLISKLRCDSALFLPYDGPYQGRGPRRKYGAKLEYKQLPEEFLHHLSVEGTVETRIYQAEVLHKEFGQPLNVVIIEKVNRSTQKRAHVILFSSDLTLAYDKLIDYYGLRFQIEFTFRDAKQYWGLEDFMTVTATGVTNAANLSLFLVNLSSVLLARFRQEEPQCSVLDLKAWYRGSKYVTELIKLLPEAPDDDLMAQLFQQMAQLGRIHPPEPHLNAA